MRLAEVDVERAMFQVRGAKSERVRKGFFLFNVQLLTLHSAKLHQLDNQTNYRMDRCCRTSCR